MSHTKAPGWMLDIALLLSRLAMGLFFFKAGWGKIFDMGTEAWMAKFSETPRPSWLIEPLANAYGHALPYVELVVGSLVILGLLSRVGTGIMSLLLLSFMIALGIRQPGLPFAPNVVFFTLALLLTVAGPGRVALDAMCTGSCSSQTVPSTKSDK